MSTVTTPYNLDCKTPSLSAAFQPCVRFLLFAYNSASAEIVYYTLAYLSTLKQLSQLDKKGFDSLSLQKLAIFCQIYRGLNRK
jgi:hypothetical protein